MKTFITKYIALLFAVVFCLSALTACDVNMNTNKKNEESTTEAETEKVADETTGEPEDTTGEPEDTTGKSETETNAPETEKATESVTEKETEKATEKVTEKETEKKKEPVKDPVKNDKPTPTCKHTKTKVVGKKEATCTKAGYSGDTYCSDCNKLVKKGTDIKAKGHGKTEIRNKKEATATTPGYTGDTYCKVCNTKIKSGKEIPKLPGGKPGEKEYTLPDGTKLWANNLTEARKISMKKYTKKATHDWKDIEDEILRLINQERKKAGLKELKPYEDAYSFTKIRAVECFTLFEHKRPDGRKWDTVYTDANIILGTHWGENLFICQGAPADQIKSQFAQLTVDTWMNSPPHRANILDGDFDQIAIAIKVEANGVSAVQNFFG